MKKFIFIILYAVLPLTVTACISDPEYLDPRKTERSQYEKNIRDLSKEYGDKKSSSYDEEKSFDLYLTHFLISSSDVYTRKDCSNAIEEDYAEFDLIFFKLNAKEKLKSYCTYSVPELIKIGDDYARKTKFFDHNNTSAMFFYYNAHLKGLHMLIDDEGNAEDLEELCEKSYKKFQEIRLQLPERYIELAKYTPFDPNAAEDL